MGGVSSRLVTAGVVMLGVAVLALAGRLLPRIPSAPGPAATTVTASTVLAGPGSSATPPPAGVLVPQAMGRTLGEAVAVMRRAGLPAGAVERDPRDAGAVVVGQEPPAGVRVPPHSPVGFRTRDDVWPNGTARPLRLGPGRATALYRIVVADPVHDDLTVVVTAPRGVDLQVWFQFGVGRLPLVEHTEGCRPMGRGTRCTVDFGALPAADPGIWTVGAGKRAGPAAAVQVLIRFTRR
jgi:hypothetical protein